MSLPPPSPRQARIIWTALTGLALVAIVAVLVALVWGLGKVLNVLAPILWPLAIAGVLAYLLDPVVDWLETKRLSRARAIILVFFAAAGLMLAVLSSIIPRVVVETGELISRIPAYTKTVEKAVTNFLQDPPAPLQHFLPSGFRHGVSTTTTNTPATSGPDQPGVDSPQPTSETTPPANAREVNWDFIHSVSAWLASAMPRVGKWVFERVGKLASWFGLIAGLALVPIYLFYFLLEEKAISGHWTEYLPLPSSQVKEELVFVIEAINDHLIAFFRGQVLVAICDSILYTIGFLIIGLDYAFLIGFCAVFLTIIPYIGAFIICAGAMMLAFAQYGDLLHTLLPLGVFLAVQAAEGFVIQPKILGDKVGLHPLVIIIAVIAGTTLLGGLLGGILAIPVAAALRVILHRYVWVKRPSPEGETEHQVPA